MSGQIQIPPIRAVPSRVPAVPIDRREQKFAIWLYLPGNHSQHIKRVHAMLQDHAGDDDVEVSIRPFRQGILHHSTLDIQAPCAGGCGGVRRQFHPMKVAPAQLLQQEKLAAAAAAHFEKLSIRNEARNEMKPAAANPHEIEDWPRTPGARTRRVQVAVAQYAHQIAPSSIADRHWLKSRLSVRGIV